jgi:hypothetical protein
VPPSRLQPRVHRDLETVCLKALAREPGQRYESALALAEDLERFQRGDAVLARRVSEIRKLLRKARRNPLPTAALAAVILLAGISPFVVHYVQTASRESEITRLRQSFEAELDQPRWEDEDYLSQMEAQVQALAERVPAEAETARQRLHQRFADYIEQRIFAATLPPEEVQRINALLDRLATRDEPTAKHLRLQLGDRARGSQPLFHLKPPYDEREKVFDPTRVRVEGDSSLSATADANPLVLTRTPCQGDVEFVAVFTAPSWETASRLGLLLLGE